MKISNLSSLNKFYVKRIGLFFAILFIVFEIIAKMTGAFERIESLYINAYILLALVMVVFSKEKTDDERTRVIRYFAIKTSYQLMIASIAIIYVLKFNVSIIYIAIFSLLLYLLIFYLSSYFNPVFIFKEETKTNKRSVNFIIGIMVLMGIVYLYNMIHAIVAA